MDQEQESKQRKMSQGSEQPESSVAGDDFDKGQLDIFAKRLFSEIKEGIRDNKEEAYIISLNTRFDKKKDGLLKNFEGIIKNEKGYRILRFHLNSQLPKTCNDSFIADIVAQFDKFIRSEFEKEQFRGMKSELRSLRNERKTNKFEKDQFKGIKNLFSKYREFTS